MAWRVHRFRERVVLTLDRSLEHLTAEQAQELARALGNIAARVRTEKFDARDPNAVEGNTTLGAEFND